MTGHSAHTRGLSTPLLRLLVYHKQAQAAGVVRTVCPSISTSAIATIITAICTIAACRHLLGQWRHRWPLSAQRRWHAFVGQPRWLLRCKRCRSCCHVAWLHDDALATCGRLVACLCVALLAVQPCIADVTQTCAVAGADTVRATHLQRQRLALGNSFPLSNCNCIAKALYSNIASHDCYYAHDLQERHKVATPSISTQACPKWIYCTTFCKSAHRRHASGAADAKHARRRRVEVHVAQRKAHRCIWARPAAPAVRLAVLGTTRAKSEPATKDFVAIAEAVAAWRGDF